MATDLGKTVQFSDKVIKGFAGHKYQIFAESYETTWGIRTTSGKSFKLSNLDMAKAFSEIIANWEEWSKAKLNINSENPDASVYNFSIKYFTVGAHKDLAEVQRRGFLHLVNAIAYSAKHDDIFSALAWRKPLTKSDYEEALGALRQNSENAQSLSTANVPAGPPDAPASGARKTGGKNILFYGAPGTGKSHDLWELVGQSPSFVTVFHPDMQNSDFIGTLKPGINDKDDVTYAFRPGPFARALACAWSSPEKNIYLIIEELNRAVAAAVFGELFQLLDRNKDGGGRYSVDFPSPEFATWFEKEVGNGEDRLLLPSNLWILSTMNSADQGVYPLDTAFRRRWHQRYLAIDYTKAPDVAVTCITPAGPVATEWRTLGVALNRFLTLRLDIGEDRLLGPRFAEDWEFEGGKLPGKILIYLWDDLLRHHTGAGLFVDVIKTYGDLNRRVENDEQIFSNDFLATFAADSADEAHDAPGNE